MCLPKTWCSSYWATKGSSVFSDLSAIESTLRKAQAPEDVFGTLTGDTPTARAHSLKQAWHKLTQVTHPDRYADNLSSAALAQRLFVALGEWHQKAEAKIQAGTYGDGKPHVEPPKPAPHTPVSITVGKRTYIVGAPIAEGDIATIYGCTYSNGSEHRAVLKTPRSSADNDLMEVEQKTLTKIWPPGTKNDGDYRLLPRLVDSFMLKGKGSPRRVNVLSRHDAYYSLLEVAREYPQGIDFRDAVWMFKRTLAVLGFVHKMGIYHGAVLPPHVLVHPSHHGAKLIDWCYSVVGSGKVRAIVSAYKSWYPPEVIAKKPIVVGTDIFMLAKCMVHLLGGDVSTNQFPEKVPRQVQAFLQGCLLAAPTKRPDDAWGLHEEFNELLGRIVGPPKYRPFAMPARA
jgi:hypothetical protein